MTVPCSSEGPKLGGDCDRRGLGPDPTAGPAPTAWTKAEITPAWAPPTGNTWHSSGETVVAEECGEGAGNPEFCLTVRRSEGCWGVGLEAGGGRTLERWLSAVWRMTLVAMALPTWQES